MYSDHESSGLAALSNMRPATIAPPSSATLGDQAPESFEPRSVLATLSDPARDPVCEPVPPTVRQMPLLSEEASDPDSLL